MQSEYEKYIKSFGGKPEFKNFKIENLIVDQGNKNQYEKIIKCNSGKGIYIHGKPGIGKSHILKVKFNLIYQEKLNSIVNKIYDERFPQWIETSEYLEALRPGGSGQKIKQDSINAHWLFIDDLGATTKTEWAVDQVFQLIDARLKGNKQTFISSNFDMNELKEFYGSRVSSRVFELCEVVNLTGKDRRQFN